MGIVKLYCIYTSKVIIIKSKSQKTFAIANDDHIGFSEPCGGSGRGACLELEDAHEKVFGPNITVYVKDDRLNWPKVSVEKRGVHFGAYQFGSRNKVA